MEEATPDNLVDLRRFREAYRNRMPPGAYDISGNISTEIPYPELPFTAPGPEARGIETSREIAPTDTATRFAPAMAPVPPEPEGICQREEPATGCHNILEEVFLLKEGNRPRRPAGLSILKVLLLVTAVGTAIGYLGFYFLLFVLSWIL